MNRPELFIKHNLIARRFSEYVLKKHSSVLQATENQTVIDVGCDPGNITFEKILPLLPKTTKKLIGVDISSAQIEYAKSHYGKDPRISYQELDLATKILPKNFIGTFNLVVSLLCLDYIKDQRLAVTNLLAMLKSGGKLLLSVPLYTILPYLYQSMYENSKWTKYMTNYNNYFITRSADYYRNLLNEVGFDEVEIEENDNVSMYTEEETFDMLTSINMFDVPEDLMKEYIQDQVNDFSKLGFSSVDEKGQKWCHWRVISNIITAVKPH